MIWPAVVSALRQDWAWPQIWALAFGKGGRERAGTPITSPRSANTASSGAKWHQITKRHKIAEVHHSENSKKGNLDFRGDFGSHKGKDVNSMYILGLKLHQNQNFELCYWSWSWCHGVKKCHKSVSVFKLIDDTDHSANGRYRAARTAKD